MDEYIKKSEAVDVILKYPYDIAGKTATAIKMIEDLPSADVVPKSEVAKEFTCFVGDPHKVDHCPYLDEIEKAKTEVETLKDNNEHLAVMLEEAKIEVERLQEEANRYKRYFFRHDYDEMIAEVLDKLDRFINSNCIEIKDERGIKGYVTSGVHFAIAEFKNKYTEGYDDRL